MLALLALLLTHASSVGNTSPPADKDDDEAGSFERPDLIAANTWQDQGERARDKWLPLRSRWSVREEWVSRSLRALDEKDKGTCHCHLALVS